MSASLFFVGLQLTVAQAAAPPATSLDAQWQTLFHARGLTADEAARRALDTSRDVAARVAAVDAASGTLDAARFGFIPRVGAGAGYTRLSPITSPTFGLGDDGRFLVTKGPAGPLGDRPVFAAPDFAFPVFLDNGQLRAGLTLPLSDYVLRTLQSVASASHAVDSARFERAASQLKAAADAKLTYYQWVRGRGQQLVAAQTFEQSQTRLGDIRRSFEAGISNKADVLRGESLVEQSRLLVARADDSALLAEEGLRTAMHLPGSEPLEVGEDISAELPDVAAPGDFEALLDQARGARVELKALGESVQSLQSQRRGAWATALPRLDGTANLLYANPNPRYIPGEQVWHLTWDVGLALSWTPTDLPVALAQVSAADARVRQVSAQQGALEDALRLELKQAVLALRENQVALSSTRKALASAEEAYRVRQELFRSGRGTTLEVVDAETELVRARLEALNARIDARVARVRFEHAAGRDAVALAP